MIEWLFKFRVTHVALAILTAMVIPAIAGYYAIWVLWHWFFMLYVGAFNETDIYTAIAWSVIFTFQIAVFPLSLAGVLIGTACLSVQYGAGVWQNIRTPEAKTWGIRSEAAAKDDQILLQDRHAKSKIRNGPEDKKTRRRI